MKNAVCRNFDLNEKGNGVLELVRLNCDKCESDDNCDFKMAYQEAKKNYIVSMEIAGVKGEINNDQRRNDTESL